MSAIYYGISENAQYRCVVARQQDQSQLYWQASNTSLPESIRQSRNLIYALPHHTIWRKVLFFPANTAPTLVYAQIIRFLKQQLPLPLEEVCFDYHIQQVEQRQRVTLFVLRQQVFRAKSIPPQAILDCEWHCHIRAYHHLLTLPMQSIATYCYPFQQQFLTWENDGIQSHLTPPPAKTLLYLPPISLSEPLVDMPLYLAALGASLWNGSALT